MSNHIKGQSRTQVTLFPEALDDFVTEDNPVRVIDVFVDELNLQKWALIEFLLNALAVQVIIQPQF